MGLYFGNNKITGVHFGTVGAGGTAITLSTPTLSLNSNTGVVTATVTQSQSGYLTAGSASNTLGLTTQAAATITPTKSAQTAVAAGKYTIGAVTVAAIPSNYIVPSGTLDITTNGTHTVTNYASVSVNVPTQSGSSVSLETATRTYTPTESSQTETITPSSGYDGLSSVGITVNAISSTYVGSGIIRRSSTDLSSSGATVTVPSGYYSSQATKSVTAMTLPTAASGSSSGTSKATITPSASNQYINIPTGYNTSASYYTISGDADLVASNIKSGVQIFGVTGTYTASGGGIDTSDATATAADLLSGKTAYAGGSKITGTIATKTSSDLTASGATVSVPAGYYATAASKAIANGSATTPATTITANPTLSTTYTSGSGYKISVSKTQSVTPTVSAGYIASGTAGTITVSGSAYVAQSAITNNTTLPSGSTSSGTVNAGSYLKIGAGYYPTDRYYMAQAQTNGSVGTPVATKGTVSNYSISITPSVSYTAGYIAGGSKTGTAVSVSASELVSGNKEITSNGTNIDVTNYATVSVSVSSSAPVLQARTGINPSTSSQTIIADAGYDGLSSVQINAMPAMTLPTSASSTYSGTRKATISRSTSAQYINIPTGYNDAAAYYQIDAVANGSATNSGSVSGTSATVSTGTNTLTLTKSVSIAPTVSAGYVSSGTAGNVSVSLTASVTTKAAATYRASTSAQTIAANTYLTGAQTIAAVSQTNLSAANIKAGTTISISNGQSNIWSVAGTFTSDATATAADINNGVTAYVNGNKITGTQTFSTIYTGSSDPSSSTGANGDVYLVLV